MPLFRQERCAPWAPIQCHADFTSHEKQTVWPNMIYILNCSLASYLYTIFQYQTCVYRTKEQYDISHEILSEMLNSKRCKDSFLDECMKMIEKFQTSMKEKENHLAFHIRLKISRGWLNKNCMGLFNSNWIQFFNVFCM